MYGYTGFEFDLTPYLRKEGKKLLSCMSIAKSNPVGTLEQAFIGMYG
jgi:hypothetical protein